MSRKVVKFGWFTVPEWEKEQKWLRKSSRIYSNVQRLWMGVYYGNGGI